MLLSTIFSVLNFVRIATPWFEHIPKLLEQNNNMFMNMYLHTVGCCQTVNENTPPRLTPAMEIGAREQAHGKQWNEKWRRVRVKTNERAVLK